MAEDGIKAKKEYKLSLSSMLGAIDQGDGSWLMKQSEDARKEFSAFNLIRFVSNVEGKRERGEHYILAANKFVNPHMYDIGREHPELQFKLFAACGSGHVQKHTYIASPKKAPTVNKARDLVGSYYPSASDGEIDMLMRLHTRQSFRDFLTDAAISSDQVPELLKAYDKLAKEISGTTKDKNGT